MTSRRILPLFALLALLTAPFGRIAAAEAMTMPHRAPQAMAGHCAGQPQPDGDTSDRKAIDCMTACAAVATVAASPLAPSPLPAAVHETLPIPACTGIRREADPPPPRPS